MSENSHIKPVLVGGLGNILMGDDGVGVHVVRKLAATAPAEVETEFNDLGTPGMSLLHIIAGRRKVVLVDCADFDAEPGAYRCFMPGEIRSVKKISGFSLHEGDLMQILRLSRRLGECPDEVRLLGIQPGYVGAAEVLSSPVAAKLEVYANVVRNIVADDQ